MMISTRNRVLGVLFAFLTVLTLGIGMSVISRAQDERCGNCPSEDCCDQDLLPGEYLCECGDACDCTEPVRELKGPTHLTPNPYVECDGCKDGCPCLDGAVRDLILRVERLERRDEKVHAVLRAMMLQANELDDSRIPATERR
jgi:hypothetical protein